MQNLSTFKRLAAILLLTCLVQAPLAHAALISFQPGTTFADTGDSIFVDLVVSGLGDFEPDSLGAYDISVGFDLATLSFTGYSLSDYLGNVAIFEAIDASAGIAGSTVNVAVVSLLAALDLDTLQPGAFTLATLNFNVIDLAPGEETLLSVLTGPVLADASGSRLTATTSAPARIRSLSAEVPVPGTLLLLITSLFGWLTLKRRHTSLQQVK